MSLRLDDMREISKEPVECRVRVQVTVTSGRISVSAYRQDGSQWPGGSHLRTLTYERTEGRTVPECVEASLRVILGAQERGEVVA